jgi:hypothetical protein
MSDMIVEIMVEVLSILAITTKEVKRGRFGELMSVYLPFSLTGYSEKYFKKLTRNREIKDSLERLNKLTQEEARMASAEQLSMMHSVEVMGVDDRVRVIEGQVQYVRNDVQDVRVDVRDVHGDSRDSGNKVDQANRSLYFQTLIVILRAQTASQGTSSETVFHDGFRRQTHPQIIPLHAKPITTAQRNGFSKEVYSIDGNPLAPSCGCTANVRYS